ncbi:MAG: hypothetical protein JO100_14865 [Pseudonocardia sp.]|nr:hypothetical protein [Pseudonocardia sp.]
MVLVFDGVATLLTLIGKLFRRPRFIDCMFRRQRPANNELLPLVLLIRAPGAGQFLGDLFKRFHDAVPRQVPHALVDVEKEARAATQRQPGPDEKTDPPPLPLPILLKLCEGLESDRFGIGRRQRFSRYKLAAWLIRQPFDHGVGSDPRRDLARRLRSFLGGHGIADAPFSTVIQNVTDPVSKLILSLFSAIWPALRFWLWVSGSVPGLGRESRWFMRQRYMAPRLSADFLGFADRLTREPRKKEDSAQVDKLLVHAFLEDLRFAYRRRPWRPHTWRRTAYTVALLDNVTDDNGGHELMRLINAVRNETGQLDPLLVIAASNSKPLDWSDSDSIECARDAEVAWGAWLRKLTNKRLLRTSTAWFLPLRVPASPDPPGHLAISDREAWVTVPPYLPRRPPLLALPSVEALAGVLLAAAAVLTGVYMVFPYLHANCALPLTLPWQEEVSVRPVDVTVNNESETECIGYSDNDRQIFGKDPRLRLDEHLIFQQNDQAKRYHENSPGRTYVSIVYFVGLTHPLDQTDSDRAQSEELEGLLLQQRQNNTETSPQPLLRVIVANGGAHMTKAVQVVNDMLVPLFQDDPSTLAVIGFDRSVTETRDAIAELGKDGIPMVATTLSADNFVGSSRLYFQMVPDNNKVAELVKDYAQNRRVTIYHPALGRGDIYIDYLVKDLHDTWSMANTMDRDLQWSDDSHGLGLASLCTNQNQNASNQIVFYAGRHEDFGEFLKEVTSGCYGQLKLTIIADDAVSRFVADDQLRSDTQLPDVAVNYISKASPVVLSGQPCLDGTLPASTSGGTTLKTFCDTYNGVYKDLRKQLPNGISLLWVGERVGVAYDTAGMLLDAAVRNYRRTEPAVYSPNRLAIIQELTSADSTNGFYTFFGVTGPTSFSQLHISENKALAILLIEDIHDLSSRPACVYMIGSASSRAGGEAVS